MGNVLCWFGGQLEHKACYYSTSQLVTNQCHQPLAVKLTVTTRTIYARDVCVYGTVFPRPTTPQTFDSRGILNSRRVWSYTGGGEGWVGWGGMGGTERDGVGVRSSHTHQETKDRQ